MYVCTHTILGHLVEILRRKKKKGGGVDRALHRFDIPTHLHTRFKITLDPSSYLLYLFFVSIGLKSFQLVIIDRPNPMAWRVGNLDSLGSESRLSFDSIQRRHFSSSQTRRNRSYLSSRHSPGLTPGDFLMGKKKRINRLEMCGSKDSSAHFTHSNESHRQ